MTKIVEVPLKKSQITLEGTCDMCLFHHQSDRNPLCTEKHVAPFLGISRFELLPSTFELVQIDSYSRKTQ